MRLSDINVNAHGLTRDEVQAALDRAKQYKDMSIAEMQAAQQKIIQEAGLMIAQLDREFAQKMLDTIRKYQPDLIEKA